jgi:hypothetical protein
MAADGAGHVLLFGGTHEDADLHDTWMWDGNHWKQMMPANNPRGREAPAMAFDGVKHVVLFGGMNENSRMLNETWTWDGSNWTQQTPTTSPGARESGAMANDGAGHVVLFGGYPGFGADDLADTWVWDGSNWTQQHTATGPSPRTVPALAYSAAGRVMLFGGKGQGDLNDTWVYESGSADFGTVKLGMKQTMILGYNVLVAVKLASSVKVLTDGQANGDFALSGSPTCVGNQKAETWCTVRVAFTPRVAGVRNGAVQLRDSSGTLLLATPIFGEGQRR